MVIYLNNFCWCWSWDRSRLCSVFNQKIEFEIKMFNNHDFNDRNDSIF